MRLLKKVIEKDGKGYIVVKPEHPEDLWHLFHIIRPEDQIKADTIRKIQKESNTGSISNERVRMNVTLEIQQLSYDPTGGNLRVSGKNIEESKFIKLGQFHTIDIELGKKLMVGKSCWDTIYLERLKEATDPSKSADVAAIILSEGTAHLCLITPYMTIERQKIDVNLPKKRYTNTAYDKSLEKFFEQILQAILRHIDFNVVKCFVIASPGFLKEQLLSYINKAATARDLKDIQNNRNKFLLCHSSTGHKQSLTEVLKDSNVLKRMEDTKAAAEVKALQDFFDTFNNNPSRAYYGFNHVFKANEQSAIQTLLVTDELFRSADPKKRKQYVDLVESVKKQGGDVKIFSSMHVSGEQLNHFSGVAAILRFPVMIEEEDFSHDLFEDDDDTSSSDDSSSDEEEEL